MKYALYIGRWQPFHNGHKWLIQQALDRDENVLIAVRDTPVNDGDPYTLGERIAMIRAVYSDEIKTGCVRVMAIPDIAAVVVGRKVGYEVRDLQDVVPPEIGGISATQVRTLMAEGDESWREKVPMATAEVLATGGDAGNGLVIWFTGLSGSGKSTIAVALESRLNELGHRVKVLDGDEVRTNLNRGLGFSKEDRDENIRRLSFVAKSVADVGGIAITAAISPYAEARQSARDLIGDKRFFMVHVATSLEECEARDVKGLYAKARAGEIKGFTGIDDPYEEPAEADCVVETKDRTVDEVVDEIMVAIWLKLSQA